jgi:glycosyltransferase involved in cell wall biosynthesis
MVPSKIQAVFAVGKPLIFVGGKENEAARWIEEAGAGWIVPEGDLGGLLAAVEAARDAGERKRRGQAARKYALAHFQREANVAQLVTILEQGGAVSVQTLIRRQARN